MGNKTLTLIGIACLALLLALPMTASASNIYATEDGTAVCSYRHDSQIGPYYYAYTYVATGSDVQVSSWTDYMSSAYWTKRAVVQMPIASLHGMQFAPGSVKLWFYSYGFAVGKTVRGMNYDPGGTITTENIQWMNFGPSSTYTLAGSVPAGGAGWIGVDVTSQVQSQVNAGYNWAGFYFNGAPDAGYDRIGSSEGGHAAYLEIVPEPSSLIALMGGLAGIGFFIRRRR